jgi:hypothetical protein
VRGRRDSRAWGSSGLYWVPRGRKFALVDEIISPLTLQAERSPSTRSHHALRDPRQRDRRRASLPRHGATSGRYIHHAYGLRSLAQSSDVGAAQSLSTKRHVHRSEERRGDEGLVVVGEEGMRKLPASSSRCENTTGTTISLL